MTPSTTLPYVPVSTDVANITIQSVMDDVNAYLAEYFAAQVREAAAIDEAFKHLWQATGDLFLHGGKRLRPYLAVISYIGCGGRAYEDILPVAVSHELLHASLLVHDDIIDRDYIRYGQDNVAGTFLKKYAQLTSNDAEAHHYAGAAALLAGDMLLSASHQWVAASSFSAAQKTKAGALLSKAIFDVCAGEFLDAESALLPPEKVDSLKIAEYKTASYSFVTPLSVGANMADASEEDVAALTRFGSSVGIAYQMVDDLLGMFGTEAVTGKSALSDLHEGKRTYLMQQCLMRIQGEEKAYVLDVLGNREASYVDLEKVRDILAASGAKAAVEALIASHKNDALAALAACNLTAQAAEQLTVLVEKALNREK